MTSLRPLTPVLAEVARVELGESPEALADGIQHLKDWINNQPHLRARTDDQWLAAFLRGCKFRLDDAKFKIDLYYSLRSTAPDLYTLKHYDRKFIEILQLGTLTVIPNTSSDVTPTLHIMRVGTYHPKEYLNTEVMAAYNFINQIGLMEDDNLTVAGLIYIIDMRNSVLAHYTQNSFKQLRNFIRANQIHMHNDETSLQDFIPREMLPKEYGGTGATFCEIKDHWEQKIIEYRDFFEEDLQYGSDETLRGKVERKRN